MQKSTFIFFVFLFISCTNTNWDKELLYGNWEVKEWVNTETNTVINAKMDFDFNSNGNYSLDYGSSKEEGTFWIMGDFLHTIEKGMAEKKVKITSLTVDQLSFEMNRGGVIEKVVLKKI